MLVAFSVSPSGELTGELERLEVALEQLEV